MVYYTSTHVLCTIYYIWYPVLDTELFSPNTELSWFVLQYAAHSISWIAALALAQRIRLYEIKISSSSWTFHRHRCSRYLRGADDPPGTAARRDCWRSNIGGALVDAVRSPVWCVGFVLSLCSLLFVIRQGLVAILDKCDFLCDSTGNRREICT